MTDAGSAGNVLSRPALPLTAIVAVIAVLWFAQPDQVMEFPVDSTLSAEAAPRYFEADYKGWQQFSSSLFDLQRVAAEDNIQLGFALIPSSVGYARYPLRREHEQMTALLDDRGISSLDLLDGLGDLVASEHRVHPAQLHPDELIHQRIASDLLERAPWDQWLQECPLGSAPITKDSEDSKKEHFCVGEGGQTEGPYLREEDGRRVASGGFFAGKRTGQWIETQSKGSASHNATEQMVLERGHYIADKREGPWREFWLRPGLPRANEQSQSSGRELSKLLSSPLWNYLGSGVYRDGARSGRWTWVRAENQSKQELLAMRCYQRGELLWAWKSRPKGEEADAVNEEELGEGHGGGAQGVENHLQMGPDGANPGPEPGQCPEGQDCSGIVPEGLPAQERNCNNQLDDDADTFIDCHDRDCANDAACRHLLPSVGNQPEGDEDSSDAEDSAGVVDGVPSAEDSAADEQGAEALEEGAIPLGDDDDSAMEFSHETIHYTDRGPDTPADVSSMTASRVWTFTCP